MRRYLDRYQRPASLVLTAGLLIATFGVAASAITVLSSRQAEGVVIIVRAQSTTGREQMVLSVDDEPVREWSVPVSWSYFTHTHEGELSTVDVAFTNDGGAAALTDLRIDYIEIDGQRIESEDPRVRSNGTWNPDERSCTEGFWETELLQCSGRFVFQVQTP